MRLGARSAARDLLRLVRALDARGVDLGALPEAQRALETVNQGLAEALTRMESPDDERALAAAEASIAGTRALLEATRRAILDNLGRSGRLKLLETLLTVEVGEDDLAVEAPPVAGDADIAHARRRAERRAAARRRGELRRRSAESQAIDVDAPLLEQLRRAPRPWLQAVCQAAGVRGTTSAEAASRALADRRVMGTVVEALRPREREALAALLDAEGVMLARALEVRFGDPADDGFDWHREPPTSVVGRLRARGLCFVGRCALGPNPRSRPRVVVIPGDLRRALADVHKAVPMRRVVDRTVPELIADGAPEPVDVEQESLRFERAQPELCRFAASMAAGMSPSAGAGGLIYHVGRVWALFEAAHPGRVPRLRLGDIERARRASARDLEAVEVMHERLLERRVAAMIAGQPFVYAFLASALEEVPWREDDKLLVFHACDTALRALHEALA